MVEIGVPLGKLPLTIHAPIDICVVARSDDALVVPGYPHLDRAGTLGTVAVDLDDVIVDARQRYAPLQSRVELVQLLASMHIDIGFLSHDFVDKHTVVGEQLRNFGSVS